MLRFVRSLVPAFRLKRSERSVLKLNWSRAVMNCCCWSEMSWNYTIDTSKKFWALFIMLFNISKTFRSEIVYEVFIIRSFDEGKPVKYLTCYNKIVCFKCFFLISPIVMFGSNQVPLKIYRSKAVFSNLICCQDPHW